MGFLNLGRCPICEWPLAASQEEGCTLDSCSYRPMEGSDEFYRIRGRRAQLALLRARAAEDNNLMDEIEADLASDAGHACPVCGVTITAIDTLPCGTSACPINDGQSHE